MDAINSIEKGKEMLVKIRESHPEFDAIQEVKECAIIADIDADTLSYLLTQMSALIFRIGVVVSEVTNRANEAYVYRKLRYMWEYNRCGNTLKVAEKESKSMLAVREQYEEELANRYVADYMQNLYKDYDRLISVLQSKLALLRNEMYKLNA